MDFGASKVVSAIVLQGRQDLEDQMMYVTKYKVQYSDGEDLWHFVTHDDIVMVRLLQNCS